VQQTGYLNRQSLDLSTYAASPVWSVVDGPWKLSAFNADGHLSFVPNKAYTGPVKPKLAVFEEVPFTTDSAEYDVLQSPSPATRIDVGYLPQQDAPAKPAGAAAGPNPLASKGYTLAPWPIWGINYYVVNYQSTTGNGPVIKQLYFRQALADEMNQAAVLAGPLRGYGTATVGPAGDPFPHNPAKARALLASHGWSVVPNGATTGTDPSRCGPGIKKGQTLAFTMPYATGFGWLASEMDQLQSNLASIGIRLTLQPKPFNQVTATAGGNCVVTKSPCNWDMADWGGGWSFAPGLPAHRRGTVPNRRGGQLRRVQQPRQRRADRPDPDQQQPVLPLHLAGLPGQTAPGAVAAQRRLPDHRDRQQPQRRHAAKPHAQPHPRVLAPRQVAPPTRAGQAAGHGPGRLPAIPAITASPRCQSR
jgi:hypothetical protein